MNRPPLSGPEWPAFRKIGARVVSRDGYPPGEGTVVSEFADRWVWVRWDNGEMYEYIMGKEGQCDLKLANPLPVQQPDSLSESGEQNDQRFISRQTQTEDLADGVVKGESLAHQNKKDQRFISRETQTEDLADGVVKGQGLAHQNKKGESIVRKHLMDLFLDSKDHDVTLTVKDKQFRAHKNILRVRSPVFAAMFAHNMTENERGEVSIEDCDPNAFEEFLKYVYVGKFENTSPVTATGLYYIADKYDFPDLKETCVEFLKSSLTTNVIAEVIPLAMKHSEDELLGCALQFVSEHMVDTMMAVEWQRFIVNNPILANEIIIKAMKISRKNPE